MMQKIILITVAALFNIFPTYGQSRLFQEHSEEVRPKEIQIRFNKNVELLGLVYFIAYLGKDIESGEPLMNFDGKPIQAK